MSRSIGGDYQRTRNDDLEELAGPEIHTKSGDGEFIENMNNIVEGLADQGEEMEIREELGLEPVINPQFGHMMQNNEDVPFSSTPSPQSPQNSPESVVDSVSSSTIPPEINRASDLFMAVSLGSEENKTKISELANSAMEELVRKALLGEPLWQRQAVLDTEIETLNEAEYIREFRAFDAKAELDALQIEASKEIGFVNMNATSIVEWLMDLKQWSLAFSKIVTRATILGVLSSGVAAGTYDETLQVMRAEFHMPTPLVPIRECQFARYCKQVGSNTWGVVDVSLENLFPYPVVRFRRRPSGCLIQEMPNGHSKVTWVEHVEVDNKQVHRIFHPQVRSGFAYSARRWVTTLIQHCDWVATLMSQTVPVLDGGLVSQNGKENLLRLAERMMRSFCTDLSACSNNLWMPLPVSGGEDVRVMTKSITPATSECPSTTIAFTSSIWLPFPPRRVYDFLRHEDSRNKWDLLSRELVMQELTYINKGDNPDNRISILQANSDSSEIEILYLQESYSDPTAFYIVYAPIDITSVATILKGGNPDYVNILPSGFVIHPDRQVMNNNGKEVGGSLLTLAFHILDGSSMEDSQFIPRESVDTVYRILTETAILIKAAVLSDDP
ncbi:hypothetical protein GH714_024235 [Hevea brasiliensis]|uniref:START domain-containing protein n=1 Tax=Hevea brasiliensis TaxID=3981 RepID=A0A6A6MKF5_HEVBR|nr:hypothetical protein GH714_024235 [Hevea brasiliensis]